MQPPVSTSPAQDSSNPEHARESVLDSRALLGREGEVTIRHEGRLYRLRRTRSGKLILTA
jgi:hemin uptake protein HemP